MSRPAHSSTTARRSTRRELMQERILEVAAEVLAAKGLADARMQDIADELRISRSLLYTYYADKSDIVLQLLQLATDEATDTLRDVLELDEPADPAGKLKLLARRLVLHNTASPALVRLLESARSSPGFSDAALEAQLAAYFRDFAALIEQGVACGQFVAVDVHVATRVVGAMIQSTRMWYHPDGPLTREEIADTVAGLVVNTLRVAPEVDLSSLDDALAALNREVARLGTPPRPSSRKRPRRS